MITKDEIMAARQAPSIGKLAPEAARQGLDGILKRIYGYKGLTVADVQAEIDTIIGPVYEKIRTRYQYFTLGEILLALEAGVCGDWGSDRRITIASVLSWLSTYHRYDVRAEAIQEIHRNAQKVTDPARMLPAAQKETMNGEACRRGVRKAWENYCNTGDIGITIDGWAASLCDYLVTIGKLKARRETIEEAFRRSRKPGEADTIDAAINSSMDAAAKRELLKMYFGSLKQRNTQLLL